MATSPADTGPARAPVTWSSSGTQHELPTLVAERPRRVRVTWQLKTLLPVAIVLLNGLLLFVLVTLSLDPAPRHVVLAVATAGAFMICAAIVTTLGFVVQRPMAELQEKIARVKQGDLDVSVTFAERNDAIGDLGRDFNQMVSQLKESREEIQRLHRTQMSRAEHLATMGELAAGLAHEIRNPLAGIAGVIEIIGRDLPPDSPSRSVLQEVRQEAININRILTDLLDAARPKAPDFVSAQLSSTAEHAIVLAREQVGAKSILIDLRAEPIPPVEHDPAQIHQVLLNLLLNAIQAIPAQGGICVGVGERDGYAAITVSDSGQGISPETLKSIFRPFFTTKRSGTGLGLSLARRIVEDHGGRIEVTSWPGGGTCFTVLLPFQRQNSFERHS